MFSEKSAPDQLMPEAAAEDFDMAVVVIDVLDEFGQIVDPL